MSALASSDDVRDGLVEAAALSVTWGLNSGRSGNLSGRDGEGMWITPSARGLDELDREDLVWVDWQGGFDAEGLAPSSEWLFHAALYQARPEFDAVVHTHSNQATALSCLRRPIPAFHYMVAAFGATAVPCAPYATFGTDALARSVVAAMDGVSGCLLANHGVVTAGSSGQQALDGARLLEDLAGQYLSALSVGEPVILDESEMRRVLRAFEGYGQPA